MVNIIHRIGIKGSAEDIYSALTTDSGLSQWWTSTTEGAGDAGSIINFKFNDTVVLFRVDELRANQYVKWSHSGDMPDAWCGTEVVFEFEEADNQVYVNFSHQKWQQASSFMAHCSTKWAVFLLSLKSVIENGVGQPFPNDVHIDHNE
ncbi:MAG: SRPBCC domain-containing protein [Gammaproteobacteria bacterium]|nr:SRPBCC domain-containing protein [Gammaproteobacteria bacterium]